MRLLALALLLLTVPCTAAEWHFGTNPGRVPLESILTPTGDPYTVIRNLPTYAEIEVTQVRGGAQGLGWIRETVLPGNIVAPCTIRMRVNVPSETTPVGAIVSLGPLTYINGGMHGGNFGTWGTGAYFTAAGNEANTASTFATTLRGYTADYWRGAEISFRTGPNAGCQLRVTGYDPETGTVTVEGAYPAVPAAGDAGQVNFRGRLIPTPDYHSQLGQRVETESMEAWLWEKWGQERPWIELACTYGPVGESHTCYDRGRTVQMVLPTWRSGLFFGRSPHTVKPVPTSFRTVIRIESLSIEGPQLAETTSGDTFAVANPVTGHSTRVAASSNVTRVVGVPTVNPDPAASDVALRVAGTWRQGGVVSCTVEEGEGYVIVCMGGIDAAGVVHYGYVRGTWDGQQLQWADEVPPAGKVNPFLALADLHSGPMPDDGWGQGPGAPWVQVLQLDDGWALLTNSTQANPDHYRTHIVRGAPDRWSFDAVPYGGQVLPGAGGVEPITPWSTSVTLWGNRDSEWHVAANPEATDPSRRLLGYGRIKTMRPDANALSNNWRPLGGFRSPDLRSFFAFPNGNVVGPVGGYAETPIPYMLAENTVAIITSYLTGKGRLWVAEDDRHFQEVASAFIPAAMQCTFRLDGQRFYVYANPGDKLLTWASIRENSEAYYEGEGWLETVPIMSTTALTLDMDSEGTVTVDVLDAATGDVLAAGTMLLRGCADPVKLRFNLGADGKLYRWRLRPLP